MVQSGSLLYLALLGAVASGYLYWCCQFLAEITPEQVRAYHKIAENVTFALTVGSGVAALVIWNIGFWLQRASAG